MHNVENEKSLGTQPILTLDGPLAEIRLQRPALHNRLLPEDLDMLERLFAEIDAAPGIRVCVLSSTGKTFSAGFDIGAIGVTSIDDPHGVQAAPLVFERMVNRLERLRVPTIAAIQGGVYGGAADLALACDFRIGVENMELRVPAALLGVHYYASGLQRFVNRIGLGPAKKIFLLAQPIDAQELHHFGYLDAVVPASALQAVVDEYVKQILALAPIPIQGMKRALNQIARAELDLETTNTTIRESMRSADLKIGLAAWAKREAPSFLGE